MIDSKAIKALLDFEAEHDLSTDEWHHADTRGISVNLRGSVLSNAHGSVPHSHELCLHVSDGKQTIIYNVANLLADACAMHAKLAQVEGLLTTHGDNLRKFLL